jgi:hypothetical protein
LSTLRRAGEADIVANVIDSAAIAAWSGSAGIGGAAEWLFGDGGTHGGDRC